MDDEKSVMPQEMAIQILAEHLHEWRDAMIELSLTLQDALLEFESRRRETVQRDVQEALDKARQ